MQLEAVKGGGMPEQDLSEESLSRVAEELKRLVADRSEPIAVKPTHIMMTGEALEVAKRMMSEYDMATLEELWDHMLKTQQQK